MEFLVNKLHLDVLCDNVGVVTNRLNEEHLQVVWVQSVAKQEDRPTTDTTQRHSS